MTRRWISGSFIVLGLVACTLTGVAQNKPFVPVTDEMLWKPNPADWLTWRRTLDSWGFSPQSDQSQQRRADEDVVDAAWARATCRKPRRSSTTA